MADEKYIRRLIDMTALVFGEILWDIINGKEYLGGAPLNFAAHFTKCGGKASIVSAVGDDNRGWRAVEQITKLGITHRAVNIYEGIPTGIVDVMLNAGEPTYHIEENVAYDFINLDESLPKLLKEQPFEVFYFGTLAQRASKSRDTLNQLLKAMPFRHIFYDVNLRKDSYTAEIIRNGLKRCTIFKLNIEEVTVISNLLFKTSLAPETFCRYIVDEFEISIVIITAADQGCHVYTDHTLASLSGIPVKVVDAVGAGDAFSAAFMFHYCHSKNAIDAARLANKVGSYVAGVAGPIPEYSEDLKRSLA